MGLQRETGFAEGSLETERLVDGKAFPKTYLPRNEAKSGASDLAELVAAERDALWEDLEQHGALLFRGFQIDTAEDFSRVVEAFGWEEMPYEGAANRTKKAKRVFTADEGPVDKFILFHHEMSLIRKSCTKIFFYCQQPSPEGGQTSIVRSDVVAKQMEEELPERVAKLADIGILKVLRANLIEGNQKQWQRMLKTEDEEEARQRAVEKLECNSVKFNEDGTADFCYGPMNPMREYGGRKVWWHTVYGYESIERNVAVTFGDGSPLPPAVVDAYGKALEDNSVDVGWRKGDVLVVDNLHVQHARRAGKPPRTVLVSVCK